MTDIEIYRNTKLKDIKEIGKKLGIEKNLIYYGKNKAKVEYENIKSKKNGKVILITATNPTPYGEGKTTVSIGLADALRVMGKNSILALREPSLGPVFGLKGGATGGGQSQVAPMDEINLHFTGDFHAITSANNLLSAAIDNHIYQGNSLEIDPSTICFYRCMDMNDRALRTINLEDRTEHFQITAASEIMTIFCMASDLKDLEKRLGDILIGYNKSGKPLFARDLQVEGAMAALLKDALNPNLVQSLEGTPALVHGGPFANIAHGCNSIIATKTAMKLADYVVTEAGFGSDLGGEKFLDIKCRNSGITPSAIVVVTTIRSLKHNGNDNLEEGFKNLDIHVENMEKYNVPVVVCLNKFENDTEEDLDLITKHLEEKGVSLAISTAYKDGGKGAVPLAEAVLSEIENKEYKFRNLYDENLSIKEKINIIAHDIYRSGNVEYSEEALEQIKKIESIGQDKLPICVAKTQYSLSDNPKLLGAPVGNTLHVKEVRLYNGAKFITILTGNILTMPGLPKKPAYEGININKKNQIDGIF